MVTLKIPVCVLCGQQFNSISRVPYTQTCQHSICSNCLFPNSPTCPIDRERWSNIDKAANKPLIEYLNPQSTVIHRSYNGNQQDLIEHFMILMASILKAKANSLSPQLAKRILHSVLATFRHEEGRLEFVRRLNSLFSRLLLELVQAQYDTKQREKSLIRLIKSKGCTILHPNLTDRVIDHLVRLYKAAGVNSTFERSVLVKYLLKELGNQMTDKRQVELIIQTLYRASCFHVIKPENEKVTRLQLKEDLCNTINLRQQHDVDLIKLAQKEHIRLPPESWARLLYSCPHPDIVSKMQSLIDRYQTPVTVEEVKCSLSSSGDFCQLSDHLNDLQRIENLLSELINRPDDIDANLVIAILEKLLEMHDLFSLRQRRGKDIIMLTVK